MKAAVRSPAALLPAVAILLLAACGPSIAPRVGSPGGNAGESGPTRSKSVTIGTAGGVQPLGFVGVSTATGGWYAVNELHSSGLVTTDEQVQRPVGRLAERAPSFEDGTISLLPDGRMRVVFQLRQGVTWHDGAPFTADDLVFTHRLLSDPGIPVQQRDSVELIGSVEAPDASTFVVNFRSAYHLGGSLALRRFWPQPRHLLQEAYERYLSTGNPEEVVTLRYWTSEYVHLGPFRLVSFDPGEGIGFEAYQGYFLGRPKVDTVRIRSFDDTSALFANLLAASVDVFMTSTLSTEQGFQLKDRWDANGDGTVYVLPGFTRFLVPQWRPAYQMEPTNLDVRVRSALYRAIDRDSMSEREPPAWSLLPNGDRLYEATSDGLREFRYDPDRARAILREVGWTPGPDGVMRHTADDRRFRNAITATAGGRIWELPVYADYWRRLGLEVDELVIPASQTRSLEVRATYPGWEASSSGGGDSVLGRLKGPAASAQTRWVGERGGYDDPRAQELLNRYFTSIAQRDQLLAMRAISDFVVAELPMLPMYFTADHVGVRRGIQALDDVAGVSASLQDGTYTRNAHRWDVL